MKAAGVKTDAHWEACNAPLCKDMRAYRTIPNWKREIIYMPGDLLCKLTDENAWSKKQEYVDRLFKKGDVTRMKKEHLFEQPLTVEDLLKL